MFAIVLPPLDPIALKLGVVEIRWYAIAYIIGLLGGIAYAYKLSNDLKVFPNKKAQKSFFEDYLFVIALAIILGGRVGYILFYNLFYYLEHPTKIFYLWEGGMSFHGALIACIIAIIVFARYKHFNFLTLGDLSACVVPIGLFFGRVANFINQELPGRITNVPWAVILNNDFVPRHPSALYEALLEGIGLFLIMWISWKILRLYKLPGVICALFFISYGFFRSIVECFREPDPQVGYILLYFTLGQILSIVMLIAGLIFFTYLLINYNDNKSTLSKSLRRRNKKLN